MGLVDYSDSEGSGSEAEAPVKAAPKPAASSKKPFQKVVDRSNPGKIVVNLPQLASEQPLADEPPAKRAKTGGSGRFSGFSSFLPAPKNANRPKHTPAGSSTSSGPPRPGVNLKTSAAPGFSRRTEGEDEGLNEGSSGGMELPPPKAVAQPTIPEGQKPADEVKLVGKPLMFKPLSVARNPQKKKKSNSGAAKPAAPAPQAQSQAGLNGPGAGAGPEPAPAPAPKKVSLFSMHTEEPSEPSSPGKQTGAYEPMFATQENTAASYSDYAQYASQAQVGPSATTLAGSESLDTVADDLNLSAAERRELFGRIGNQAAKKVINFNMDREYQHNEEVRAAGEQQIHNPVRALGGGKHSLRQLVQNVQNQREALEDSFAKGKSNRKEASSKYGW
ncbi:hypothetical protein ACJ41O_011344 [Fusarium nematophilum]